MRLGDFSDSEGDKEDDDDDDDDDDADDFEAPRQKRRAMTIYSDDDHGDLASYFTIRTIADKKFKFFLLKSRSSRP